MLSTSLSEESEDSHSEIKLIPVASDVDIDTMQEPSGQERYVCIWGLIVCKLNLAQRGYCTTKEDKIFRLR